LWKTCSQARKAKLYPTAKVTNQMGNAVEYHASELNNPAAAKNWFCRFSHAKTRKAC